MRIPTVKIRNLKTGKIRKINAIDWATDLGQGFYSGWERISEPTKGDPDRMVAVQTAAGKTRVTQGEAETMNDGVKETPGYIRRRHRRRYEPDVEVVDREPKD